MHTFALAAGIIALCTQAAPVRADSISYTSVNESVSNFGEGQLGGTPGVRVGNSTSNKASGIYQSNLSTAGTIQYGSHNSVYSAGAYGSSYTFQNSDLSSGEISSAIQLTPFALAYSGGQSAAATGGASSSLETNFRVDTLSLLQMTGSDNITDVLSPGWDFSGEVYSASEQFILTDLTTGTTLFSAPNAPSFSAAVTLNPSNLYSLSATLSESISITANGAGSGNFHDQEAYADLNFDASVTPTPVPEPGAVWLMLSGLCGIGIMASRRRGGAQEIVSVS
jgi:hypothetical protein